MNDMLGDVRAVLATTPDRWQSLADKVPTELLNRPAAPGEWSAVQCLWHLLDTESLVFPGRVRAFLEGRDIPAFDPDSESTDYSKSSFAELVADFARRRQDSVALLGQVSPSDLERTSIHSDYGSVTLGQLLPEWVAHDLMHTVQAERALMQAFIPDTGPWRDAFADHDLHADS